MSSPQKQTSTNLSLIKTRISNEKYLREHPEVKLMLSKVTEAVLREQPKDLAAFVADWFNDEKLEEKVLGEGMPEKQDEKWDMRASREESTDSDCKISIQHHFIECPHHSPSATVVMRSGSLLHSYFPDPHPSSLWIPMDTLRMNHTH